VVDELVVNALRMAIAKDTEIRLVAVGEAAEEAGLFPDRKSSAKKAIKASTEGEKPLLLVREEPGKSKTLNEFARITVQGISTLVGQVPLKDFPDLIAASAPSHRTKVLRSCLRALARRSNELDPWNHRRLVNACLKITQTEFEAIESRYQEIVKEEQLLCDTIEDFLKTTRGRIEKQKQQLTTDLESMANAMSALVAPTEIAPADQTKRPRLPDWQRVPNSDTEIDFQKNLSEELVFAWQDATTPDARSALERALFNVGVERLNAPGDIVEFDGTTQHAEDEVNLGDSVEVILPAWQLVNPRGTHLLARGKVARARRTPASMSTPRDSTDDNVSDATRRPKDTIRTERESDHLEGSDEASANSSRTKT
jgi:hypothetical protein